MRKKRSKGKVEIEMKHFSIIKNNWIFVIYEIFNLKKDAEWTKIKLAVVDKYSSNKVGMDR